jgi:hypothetical protein
MRFPVYFVRGSIIGLSGLVLAACLLQACALIYAKVRIAIARDICHTS